MNKRLVLVLSGLIISIGIVSFIIALILGDIGEKQGFNGRYTGNYLLNHPPDGWSVPSQENSNFTAGMLLFFTIISISIISVMLIRTVKQLKA